MSEENIYNIVKDNISFSKRLDGNKTIKAIRSILIKRENAYIKILKDDVCLDSKNQRNIISKEDEKKKSYLKLQMMEIMFIYSQKMKKKLN